MGTRTPSLEIQLPFKFTQATSLFPQIPVYCLMLYICYSITLPFINQKPISTWHNGGENHLKKHNGGDNHHKKQDQAKSKYKFPLPALWISVDRPCQAYISFFALS